MSDLSGLMQIQPFIQAYVLAVASILDAPVTVVDNNMIRVGGTIEYEGIIGKKVTHSVFFDRVLKTGKPGFVSNVKKDEACNHCQNRSECPELADMAYPIFLDGKVAGLIGIVAFREDERSRLLRNQVKLGEFLKYMCMLIESKLQTEQRSAILEHQLDDLVNAEHRQLEETPFLGESGSIKDILTLVDKISPSDSTVLLSGESGTGKEIMARTIHNRSQRAKRLMVSINCGAIPESLVESELFGYEEGAFTGARKGGHIGKFELANESTLFLDEIGEMPLAVQTRLLRVLQEQSVQRLGGSKPVPVNVRVICASNRDLRQQVEEGSFRKDLYYRLNVIPITLPPLRERRGDIPIFIRHFLARYNNVMRKSINGLEQAAMSALMSYDWPGNVRELRNIIEYLVNIVDGPLISLTDLPEHFLLRTNLQQEARSLRAMMSDHERLLLCKLVAQAATTEDKKALAKTLGISNATLYRKLAEHRLLR